MKRISVFLICILMFSFVSFADEDARDIKIWVDGNYIFSDVNPLIVNSRTQVPVRFIAEELGFDVKWLAETREVHITDSKTTLKLTIDSYIAIVDNQEFKLDNKVFIKDSRTYLPLRFISESFGKKVDYHAETKTAIIGDNFIVDNYYPIKFFQSDYSYIVKEDVRFTDNSVMDNENKKDFNSEKDLLYYFKRPITKFVLNEKDGLIDIKGNIVLDAKYDYIGHYDKGYYRFNKNEKMGLLDSLGNVVIEPKYDFLDDIKDGYIRVKLNEKMGIIDLKGNVIIDLKYDMIRDYSDGYFVFKKDDQCGVITENKEERLFPEYSYLSSFYNGIAVFEKERKFGLIDKNFNEIASGYEYIRDSYDGLNVYRRDGMEGILDDKGNEITEAIYKRVDIRKKFKDIVVVIKDEKEGLIDRNGNIITGFKYDFLIPLSDEYIKFNIGGKYGHGDIHGGKWGIIDKKGNIVIEANYDNMGYEISPLGNIIVVKDLKYGIINISGKVIVPLKYYRIEDYSDGLAVFSLKTNDFKGDIEGVFDEKGNIVIKPIFDYLAGFHNGVSVYGVQTQLKTGEGIIREGLIDKKGNILIEAKYNNVSGF